MIGSSHRVYACDYTSFATSIRSVSEQYKNVFPYGPRVRGGKMGKDGRGGECGKRGEEK